MPNELSKPQSAFLNAYRATGTILRAAELLEMSADTHYHALRDSEAYRQSFAQAQKDSSVALKDEARYRALNGSEVPIYQGGKLVGHWVKRSDRLLVYLLGANHPTKFRRRS